VAELEGFRYRVQGVSQAVTKKAIKEARLRDLRNEMINSETLKAHFEENPRDLQILKHDAPLKAVKVQRHLSHVPSYLMPGALAPQLAANADAAAGGEDFGARTSAKRKWQAKHKRGKTYQKSQKSKRRKDPLF
jgi:ATP-dependent RNA helicase DDX56/DBP9